MWSAFAKWLLGFVTGPALTGLIDAYKAKLAAGNDAAKIAADLAAEHVKLDQREAELNSATVAAEEGNPFTRWVRPALAAPVVIVLFKLLVWDLALGQWTGGHTPPIDANRWQIIFTVVVAYMGGRSLEKITARIFSK